MSKFVANFSFIKKIKDACLHQSCFLPCYINDLLGAVVEKLIEPKFFKIFVDFGLGDVLKFL